MDELMLNRIIADSRLRAANETTDPCMYTIEQLECAVDILAGRVDTLHTQAANLRNHYEAVLDEPKPLRICCEICGTLHIDTGDFKTKPHKSHTCQKCGHTWMPALFHTVGVRFLPGTQNSAEP